MKSLIVCVMLVCSAGAFAQQRGGSAAVKTDREIYPPPPAPALPRAGGTFVDPTFGTTIMRVTDERDGKDNHVAYSYWPTFNKDSTRLIGFVGGTSVTYRFDPKGFKLGEKEPIFDKRTPAGTTPRWEDSIWSGTDPDAIFAHDLSRLWRFDLKTKQYSLLKDFGKDLNCGIKQMSRSNDDKVFAFTTTDGEGESGFIAWQHKPDKVLHRAEGADLDEVQVDKSGRWLLVKTRKQGEGLVQALVVDLSSGQTEELIDDAPDYAPGHSDNGTGTCVGHDNWKNRFTFRELATPHEFISVLDMGNDWTQGSHLSFLADDERWCVISLYEWKPAAKPGPFHSEIIMAATDGSQRVRRLAHHRSVINGEYWNCPLANISRDGRFIAFTSNFGGRGQRDIFILRVPQLEPAGG